MVEMEQLTFSFGQQGAERREEILQPKRRYTELPEFRTSLDLSREVCNTT